MNGISPRYQMSIVQNINDRLFELYKSYEDVANYLDKWHSVYNCCGDNENLPKLDRSLAVATIRLVA